MPAKKFWAIKNAPDPSLIQSRFDVDYITACLIASRAGDNPDIWCIPKISVSAPDPRLLPDIKKLCLFISSYSKIGIFSDYDVDGVLSAVMWKEFLESIGKQAIVYFPDRKSGYGPNAQGINHLYSQGAENILFLDCGTDCHSLIKEHFAIIDHHIVKNPAPLCSIFINPYRGDLDPKKAEPFLNLCTAGLSFLVISCLVNTLNIKYPPSKLIDLAGIATVADVMPLSGFNRAIVKSALRIINLYPRQIISFLTKAKNSKKITSHDIGYNIAPKINSAGRVEHAKQAFDACTSNNPALSAELERCNETRREQETQTLQEAISMIANQQALLNNTVIVVASPTWNLGVVGIVASRLQELHNKPVFVLRKCEDVFKGSVRSTSDVNIGKWISHAVSNNLIINGGGHKKAGGVSFSVAQTKAFIDFLNAIPESTQSKLTIDLETSITAIHKIQSLDLLEPFGYENPIPKFLLRKVYVRSYKTFKDTHASITFSDNTSFIIVTAFNVDQGILKKSLTLDIVISPRNNKYILVDFAIA